MALRDSPRPLGPSCITPCTFVARTISSRLAISPRARPTISSLDPAEYTLAVSKKLMPASSAWRIKGRLASSSRVQGWLPRFGSPKLMQPRQMTDTSIPVRPSFTYLTSAHLLWGPVVEPEPRRPAVLDAAVPPDQHGTRPGHHEHAHDDESGGVDVEPVDEVPEPVAGRQAAHLPGEDAQGLDGADEEADRHGQTRDGEVVVHLAHRVEERPAVGDVHEHAIGRVHQGHAGREQDRQADDGVPRHVLRGVERRRGEDGLLRGGVESAPEEDADGVHVLFLVDGPHPPAEEAVEGPAVL